MNDTRIDANRQSEVLDVQLLDAFVQIEALLRLGREIQREALRVRGLPHPVSPAQRRAAGQSICQHLDEMRTECRTLGDVMKELQKTATKLDKLVAMEEGTSVG
jgi:hypothetical protein